MLIYWLGHQGRLNDSKEKKKIVIVVTKRENGKMDKNYEYWVYVLRLNQNKYYVGISRDVKKRFEQHKCGEGAEFTKLYKPIQIIHSENTGLIYKKDAEHIENIVTIQWMLRNGVENVRGGDYCTCDQEQLLQLMDEETKTEILENECLPELTSKKSRKLAKRIYDKSPNKQKRDAEIKEREKSRRVNGGTYCQVEMCWNNRGKKCQLGITPWDKKRCEKNYRAK